MGLGGSRDNSSVTADVVKADWEAGEQTDPEVLDFELEADGKLLRVASAAKSDGNAGAGFPADAGKADVPEVKLGLSVASGMNLLVVNRQRLVPWLMAAQ